jgi:hypothetical protein
LKIGLWVVAARLFSQSVGFVLKFRLRCSAEPMAFALAILVLLVEALRYK